MQEETQVVIRLSPQSANKALVDQQASTLSNVVRQAHRGLEVQRLKVDQTTQNAGEIVQVVLTSAAISSLASGIGTWLARNSGAWIRVDRPDGTHVDIRHSGENIADAIKAIFSGRSDHAST